MSYGAHSVFTRAVTSGTSVSSAFDLQEGWGSAYLVVSMISNSTLHIQGSADDVTYQRIYHPPINSVTVANAPWTVNSAISNAIVPLPAGFRYMKVEQVNAAVNGQTFKIICGA